MAMIQQVLRTSYQSAHNIFEQVLDDITPEALATVPAGANIQAIQAIIAHAVLAEDWIVNSFIGKRPQVASAETLAGTGVPVPDRPQMTPEWAAGVKMDLPKFREFAKKVFVSAEDTIGSMSDEAMAAEVDGPFGKHSAATYLTMFGLYHIVGHTGEIAAIKGVHGLKGLPF
jgi:hypothetical protein